MHPTAPLERFVSNNPALLQSPLSRLVPQSVTAISREGVPMVATWGDGVERTITLHSDRSGFAPQRVIYHPGLREAYVYEKNPDRTVNYYRGPVRKWDTQSNRTLSGHVRSRRIQRWEDVVITEYWEGGGNRASMTVSQLQALYAFFSEDTPIGEFVGWLPRDLSFNRHLIYPLTLTVGNRDFDLNAIRERPTKGAPEDMVVDQAVAFSFGLAPDAVFVPSVLNARGA